MLDDCKRSSLAPMKSLASFVPSVAKSSGSDHHAPFHHSSSRREATTTTSRTSTITTTRSRRATATANTTPSSPTSPSFGQQSLSHSSSTSTLKGSSLNSIRAVTPERELPPPPPTRPQSTRPYSVLPSSTTAQTIPSLNSSYYDDHEKNRRFGQTREQLFSPPNSWSLADHHNRRATLGPAEKLTGSGTTAPVGPPQPISTPSKTHDSSFSHSSPSTTANATGRTTTTTTTRREQHHQGRNCTPGQQQQISPTRRDQAQQLQHHHQTPASPSPSPPSLCNLSSSTSNSSHPRFLRTQHSTNTLASPPPLTTSMNAHNDPLVPKSPLIYADDPGMRQLVQELNGSMEGHLQYEISDEPYWLEGYCAISLEMGSLIHFVESDHSSRINVVIPELRGCQVRADSDLVVVTTTAGKVYKIRPISPIHFEKWVAALLGWSITRAQPLQYSQPSRRDTRTLQTTERERVRRRNSDALPREPPIIKVGKMLLWRRRLTPNKDDHRSGSSSSKSSKGSKNSGQTWQKISCTLQENGEFRIYPDATPTTLTRIHLTSLSRCAVQPLDPSILGADHCIAIYPQYRPTPPPPQPSSLTPPFYLALDSRISFEVWFVLLRAYTQPELFGTPPSDPSNLQNSYRVQRSLFLRIVEAKIYPPQHGSSSDKDLDVYAEVHLDNELRAKTMIRTKTHNPFWREDYEFTDLPAAMSDCAVVLKQRDPRWKSKALNGTVSGLTSSYGGGLGGASTPGASGKDAVIGRVDVHLDELKYGDAETWYPLVDESGRKVGEMFLKMQLEELVVLMAEEYKPLLELLGDFGNGLTLELAGVLQADLTRLSSTLLKIFQVGGRAGEWIMRLAEMEIDGMKAGPVGPSSTSTAVSTTPSTQPVSNPTTCPTPASPPSTSIPPALSAAEADRPHLRDANILFRGNSLLTKSLDAHMRRLGRSYLDSVLSPHLTLIASEDLHCEVDPSKLPSHLTQKEREAELAANWKTFLKLTRAIWESIYSSHDRCPVEIRRILRHIRTCVEERYGSRSVNASYSSVSGFLFLRFFCPAVLNPKLFGLLKDHPGVRAQRTLTLVAKSLQGLANMSPFGIKEPWMEGMNEFLEEHVLEFKDFVHSVISVPCPLSRSVSGASNGTTPAPEEVCTEPRPPQYQTPLTILERLSPEKREGFPSLPYLIDAQRCLAGLVNMWWKGYPAYLASRPKAGAPTTSDNPNGVSPTLHQFDLLTRRIRERIEEVVEKAQRSHTYVNALDGRKGSFSTTASEPLGGREVDALYHSHVAHPLASEGRGDRFYKGNEKYYASSTSTLVGTGGREYDRRELDRERRYDVSQGWDEKVAALALRDEFEFSPTPRGSGRTQTFTSATMALGGGQLIQHPGLFGQHSPPQSSSSTGSFGGPGKDGGLAFINAGSVGNEISRFHTSHSNRSRDGDEEVVVLGEGGYGYGVTTGNRPPGSSGSAGSGVKGKGEGAGGKLAGFIVGKLGRKR
ncbi:hypothetical protein BJ508DRAFT_365869 [Ascobolus immersus RN42]|uniref:Uncharacterized protein n=1 Tax=Ascobolus immersus RN42 TaxID=1160509 RepID=A0A3N4HSZ6_ASCIM|nr:hypothetical protein BJ508DRAFT_365869 [Ascobolus immersus RN42]